MKKIILILGIALQLTTCIYGATDSLLMNKSEKPMHITVNNRILAKVNGKAISVMDVMKKMDMAFYKQYSQYAAFPEARIQYYQMQWRNVLQDIIHKELIAADAEEHKIKITSGEVRQDMEKMFGPNIIANLDKAGLTFDEAWNLVYGERILSKMIGYQVQSKAYKVITPQYVRNAYEKYAVENVRPPEWLYSVISIRHRDVTKGAEAANISYQLLTAENIPADQLADRVKTLEPFGKNVKISISEEYRHNENELSPSYKEILTTLKPGSYSQPSSQKSRSDNSIVFRIFYLKEHFSGGALAFSEVEKQIRDKLFDETIEKETEAYLKKLRLHFNLQEEVTDSNFEPFSLSRG